MTEETLALLTLTGNEIQNVVRNFKKDSQSRKNNAFYFQERMNRLQSLENEFKATNAKLQITDIPEGHDYFKKNYYRSICELVTEYQNIFQSEISRLEELQTTSKNVELQPLDDISEEVRHNTLLNKTQRVHTEQVSTPNLQSNGILRRFAVKLSTLERFIDGIADNILQQPTQYRQVKRESLQGIWQQLEELYDLIWDQYEDPTAVGVNLQKYIDLEKRVQDQIIQLSVPTGEITTIAQVLNQATTPQILPLPKLVIPIFDGDYLKWSQFFDLFSHMVDKQPLPNVQKCFI